MANIFERTIGLIGKENFDYLQNKTIAVVGLGGVGGTALEALVRSGFNKLVIMDMDEVDASNINRQILYTSEDIGKRKVLAAKDRIVQINKDVNVTCIDKKMNSETAPLVKADFIVDAIDDVEGKIALAKYAFANDIPFIVSLGMANRLDPSKVTITKLNKTTSDPLAKKIRYEFKKNNIDISKVFVVFSSEEPLVDNGKLHSMMMVPSSAGLNIANYVINYFVNEVK